MSEDEDFMLSEADDRGVDSEIHLLGQGCR